MERHEEVQEQRSEKVSWPAVGSVCSSGVRRHEPAWIDDAETNAREGGSRLRKGSTPGRASLD